jgi:hypothetical protein
MNKPMEDKNLKFYPFNGYYINLETLQRIEIDELLPTNFKSLSDYAFRFYAPENWINNFYQDVTFHNCRFKIENDLSIRITDRNTSESIVIKNPDKDIKVDRVSGAHFLFATQNGIIEVKRLEGKNGYRVRNYNEQGKCRFSTEIEHTHIDIKGNTYYHKPYLYYYTCTDDWLVFTSNNREFHKTVQVNLKDGKVSDYPFRVNGVIRTDDEANIPGFICMDEEKQSFRAILLNHSWNCNTKNLWANTAETVLIDNVLYVAFYHGIATGSSLYAYDMLSGKELWKADVKQLNVDHSEYYNKVYLSAYKDRIIMEGIEAEGKYVQIFDAKTGKRLYCSFQ